MNKILNGVVALTGAQFLLCGFLCFPAAADDREKLLGSWQLESFYYEDVDNKQRYKPFGDRPSGYIAFTPTDRFFAVTTAEGRKAAKDVEGQAAAFRSIFAYSGKFRIEGNKFIVKVDAAWNPDWVSTEQVRFFRLEGDKLYITSAPLPNPNVPRGGMVIGILVWTKE